MRDDTVAPAQAIHVSPGQMIVSSGSRVLHTVLGSCVSVCLWDPELKIGGMNHFMLPEAGSVYVASLRHGDFAMRALVSEMEALRCRRSRLSARVYGGASVLDGLASTLTLGARNVDFAIAWLEAERIPLDSAHVLGTSARRVKFELESGVSGVRLLGVRT
jgi:chemotaxis protein CheD